MFVFGLRALEWYSQVLKEYPHFFGREAISMRIEDSTHLFVMPGGVVITVYFNLYSLCSA
jgi:hypothetical protein